MDKVYCRKKYEMNCYISGNYTIGEIYNVISVYKNQCNKIFGYEIESDYDNTTEFFIRQDFDNFFIPLKDVPLKKIRKVKLQKLQKINENRTNLC